MKQGISIYFGLDNTYEENMQLLEAAADAGITRIFTSLHIPEADYRQLQNEFTTFLTTARESSLEVIADISPLAFTLLDMKKLSFSVLKAWGLHIIRPDFGYTPEQIAAFTHNKEGIHIQVNASTITADALLQLASHDADFSRIDALHNFYPRRGTGLAEETVLAKNELLHQWNISTGAFVPSQNRKRAPLYEGTPTLEAHRDWDVSRAARHLAAIGTDSIFIGDSLPSLQEMRDLAACQKEVIEIKIKLLTAQPSVIAALQHTFTARLDAARDAIRAQESRQLLKAAAKIEAENTAERRPGAVTIDNAGYQRYMGELQIIQNNQPPDPRVNVVAQLLPEEVLFLSHITPGRKFRFVFI